jgi:hypothetical protein
VPLLGYEKVRFVSEVNQFVSSSLKVIARSIIFRNSRTLPGKYCSIKKSERVQTEFDWNFPFSTHFLNKMMGQDKMSCPRSRNGGIQYPSHECGRINLVGICLVEPMFQDPDDWH